MTDLNIEYLTKKYNSTGDEEAGIKLALFKANGVKYNDMSESTAATILDRNYDSIMSSKEYDTYNGKKNIAPFIYHYTHNCKYKHDILRSLLEKKI